MSSSISRSTMYRWVAVLWLGLCALLFSCPAGAVPTSPIDDAPLRELTQRSSWPEFTQAVQYLERRYLEPALRVREGRLVAQLNEGRLYYLRKDYRQAAMLLLEVVEAYRAQRRRDPLYRDALYYLADAFYYIQNERSAARLFEELLSLPGVKSQRRSCASGRLIQIAMRSGRLTTAQRFHEEARRALSSASDHGLIYFLGKYSYEQGRFEEAGSLWQRIPAESPLTPQSLYLQGVALIRLGKLSEAKTLYQKLITLLPEVDETGEDLSETSQALMRSPEADAALEEQKVGCKFTVDSMGESERLRRIRNHAQLALARIAYEEGALPEALNHYLSVSRDSPLFRDAIRESVWVAVKEGRFEQALQRLDVQLIDEPNALIDPETRFMQGRLYTVLGRFEQALSSLTNLREGFETLKSRVIAPIMRRARGQLARYFQGLLNREETALNLQSLIPEELHGLLGDSTSAALASTLYVELNAQGQDIESATRDIETILWALEGENRSEMFPQLHEGLLQSVSVHQRLLLAWAGRLKALAVDDEARQKSAALSAEVEQLPASAPQLQGREQLNERRLQAQELFLSRLALIIQSQEAQLNALRRYLEEVSPEVIGPILTPSERVRVLAQIKSELDKNKALRVRHQRLGIEIRRQILRVGLYDEAFMRDEAIREELSKALEAEQTLRVQGGQLSRGEADQIKEILSQFKRFTSASRRLAQENSETLKAQVVAERRLVSGYQKRQSRLSRAANLLGGQLVAQNLYRIIHSLDQLILRAEANILDVAWSQKNQHSARREGEERRREMHLKVINRDLVGSP